MFNDLLEPTKTLTCIFTAFSSIDNSDLIHKANYLAITRFTTMRYEDG